MLAQNFKSATDLGITDEEHSALITVLYQLVRGELVHAPQSAKIDNGFNMGTQGLGCGTPACIGGWVAHHLGIEQMPYVDAQMDHEKPLHELYWGRMCPDTTPDQAAAALRNFLVTGSAKWREAVA